MKKYLYTGMIYRAYCLKKSKMQLMHIVCCLLCRKGEEIHIGHWFIFKKKQWKNKSITYQRRKRTRGRGQGGKIDLSVFIVLTLKPCKYFTCFKNKIQSERGKSISKN